MQVSQSIIDINFCEIQPTAYIQHFTNSDHATYDILLTIVKNTNEETWMPKSPTSLATLAAASLTMAA